MKTYKKKPFLYSQQIEKLKNRGLIIPDEKKAERYLNEISYYRLSAYAQPHQKVKDKFNTNTTFQDVLNLYLFDRELRLLVLDAIERIEIAIRSQMIYTLAHKYKDSHWQDNAAIFNPPHINPRTGYTFDIFADTQDIIDKHLKQKHPEEFVKHYKAQYNAPKNPPAWMSIELLTIGELSRLFTALKLNPDRQAVASFFKLHHTVFTSWLHTLVYVRNLCAHHSRLWNREFAIKPDALKKPQLAWIEPAFNTNNHRTFYTLSILKYLLASANPGNHFKQKLEAIINKYPNTPIQYMGIPTTNGIIKDWKQQDIWK